jgi:uncharacterized membrane protein YagU involved in acid resistance
VTANAWRAAIIAGLVGGIVLDVFLIVAGMLTSSGASPAAILISIWQFVAEWAVGKQALSSTSYAYLGAFIHFAVSIGWAFGFVWVAKTRPQVVQQPIVSGVVYGIIVWIGTQLVLVAAGLFKVPTPPEAETEILAYCVFFGIPLAYTVSRIYDLSAARD